MVEIKEDITIGEDGSYGKESALSMKAVVHSHIQKISGIACKEFTGGYWNKKPVQTHGGILFLEEYHEDVREAYCNAVDFLIDILYPQSDDDFKKYVDDKEKINLDLEIMQKLKLKRETFRQINKMFDRTNFFGAVDGYSE